MAIQDGDAQTVPISELLEAIENRHLVLPRFQRKLKWNWEKQKSLLISLSLDMPIGMFMVWNKTATPGEDEFREMSGFNLPSLPDEFESTRRGIKYFLLDGQQRLTFLASIRYLDPEQNNDLKYINCKIGEEGGRDVISFTQSNQQVNLDPDDRVFNLQQLIQQGNGVDARFANFSLEDRGLISTLSKGLTSKPVLVQSLHSNFPKGLALYSYDTLNTAGTKLGDEDMAEAKLISVYPSLFMSIRNQVEALSTPLFPNRSWSKLFTRSMLIKSLLEEIYRTTIPSLAETRGLKIFNPKHSSNGDYDNNPRIRDLSKNSVKKAWGNVTRSMERLKSFMNDWGLTDPKRMVSSYLIVAAAYLRQHCPGPRDRLNTGDENRLKAWMLRSQLWRHHTGGSTQKKLDRDCSAARSGDWTSMYSVAREERQDASIEVQLKDFGLPLIEGNGTPADTQFILEIMRQVAINKNAVDFDGTRIDRFTEYSKDHIFPQSLMTTDYEDGNPVEYPTEFWDHPLNIMFISRRSNSSLQDERPSRYLPQLVSEGNHQILSSQCVPYQHPETDNFLRLQNYDAAPTYQLYNDQGDITPSFLHVRGQLILDAVNDLLRELEQ